MDQTPSRSSAELADFLEIWTRVEEDHAERIVNQRVGAMPKRTTQSAATLQREHNMRYLGQPVLSDCKHPIWLSIQKRAGGECEICDYNMPYFVLVSTGYTQL